MIFLYLTIIVASNVITAMFPPFALFNGSLLIPTGSVFVGVTFMLRDFVQMKYGKRLTYVIIFTASMISVAISRAVGDTMHVAVASMVAFLVSESLDTEIFSRLKKSFLLRIMLSGIIGGIADSLIFVTLGLGPIGAAMITWNQVPYAVLGQAIVKVVMQPVGVLTYMLFRKKGVKK